jgi:hypothetical protein
VWGLKVPTNIVRYVIAMPLAFLFLIRILWVLHRVDPMLALRYE